MSQLFLDEKSGKISNVHFAYVKIQKGGKKYESEELEYSVDVVVDKATAKEMKKNFPKNGLKEVDTAEFEEKYKFSAPYPDQDEQYLLKFKTNVADKNGEEKPYSWSSRPKVYVPDGDKIKDVTMDVRVGNGSSGDIAFNVSNGKFGQIHHLSAILVKDMIELVSNRSTPFGELSESNENEHYEEMAEEFAEDVGF
jgi:hypothetical protein